ncbi:MAG: nucleotide exchange factor GrpE [Clostridiales bacterium]|nr:nucleotide exchange factor GrpE [Clostridiales bacterium]
MSKKKENEVQEKEKVKAESEVIAESVTIADETTELKTALAEAKNDYLRLAADFDNYKKRNNVINAQMREIVTENVIEEFIPLADNYELALKYLDEKSKAGVMMIYRQLLDVFARFNVREIEVLGKPFDPKLHEAIEQTDGTDAPSGTVVEVLQKGYSIGDKVLRYASVKVAK